MLKNSISRFLYAFFAVGATAGLCGYLNDFGLNTFYRKIDLPLFTPPDNVFPLAWGVLYALLIISTTLVLNTTNKPQIKYAAQIFWLNLLLQIIWTYVFFYSGMFLAGFFVIILLDFAAILLANTYYRLNKVAAILLVPYIFWLLLASYLNWGIVDLNGNTYIF